jgi:hypothetical protein
LSAEIVRRFPLKPGGPPEQLAAHTQMFREWLASIEAG